MLADACDSCLLEVTGFNLRRDNCKGVTFGSLYLFLDLNFFSCLLPLSLFFSLTSLLFLWFFLPTRLLGLTHSWHNFVVALTEMFDDAQLGFIHALNTALSARKSYNFLFDPTISSAVICCKSSLLGI